MMDGQNTLLENIGHIQISKKLQKNKEPSSAIKKNR
jgi:hypothetical protein